jgi:hypothetical protein
MCRDSVPGVDPPRSEPEAESLLLKKNPTTWRRITLLGYNSYFLDSVIKKIGRFFPVIRPRQARCIIARNRKL